MILVPVPFDTNELWGTAELRRKAAKGSAVDALLVAFAEPGGTVLTGDTAGIEALAAHASDVVVEIV